MKALTISLLSYLGTIIFFSTLWHFISLFIFHAYSVDVTSTALRTHVLGSFALACVTCIFVHIFASLTCYLDQKNTHPQPVAQALFFATGVLCCALLFGEKQSLITQLLPHSYEILVVIPTAIASSILYKIQHVL